ncbi:hypothetical protein Cni_G00113 [Canna indica]|uniref:Uncharacterized protein n=1 Tax=Canna indica TaxID=4628 RepID=A0AAQ3JKT4_9LILI|nr:hypothetical protein Cni_G00113 [Canna indica]
MSTGRQTMRDLAEEAKKRVVLLLICVFGLSYLMSLTSSSVWVNLPIAAAVIIFSLYLSRELDIRRKATMHNINSITDESSPKLSVELHQFPLEKSDWRKKVNSPVVEAAIEQFTRHLVSEWVVDLWYSRITPDRDGPEELVEIMNGAIGEISSRARDVNLIDLLTRDIVNLICSHLELYRYSQSKIGKQEIMKLPTDQRDIQLKLVLAAENKLHPALLSLDAEHKVLQNLANGLMSIVFKPEDLQCSFFRYTVRELLACTVIRPILNLVNPRFVNERIESLALSHANKASKKIAPSAEEPIVKRKTHLVPDDQASGSLDHSSPGVELVPFKTDNRKVVSGEISIANGMCHISKGSDSGSKSRSSLAPRIDNFHVNSDFASNEARVSCSNNSLQADSQVHDGQKIGSYASGSEWAHMLDTISRRKSQALAPEHLDNMWAKGRNYKKKEANKFLKSVAENSSLGFTNTHPGTANQDRIHKSDISKKTPILANLPATDCNGSNHSNSSFHEETEHGDHEEVESESENSYTTEDDENSTVTGLDSPGTRVWESKNKKNSGVSSIRHPLETSEVHAPKRSSKIHVHHHRTSRASSGRRRSRSSNQKIPLWQEVERTSFLVGDGHDILNTSKKDAKSLELSDDSDVEVRGRIYSGAVASSSFSSVSASESSYSSMKSPDILVLADTFLKLRCEVLGANIVKSGSGTLAVYSISVTDANNNSWFIKRRFRHFEELHRRLKEFPEYNLHLPPKHFLSSGLDVPVVQERCKLLDIYLKKLLQIPSISESIEVWDFLSIDSQTYVFSDSLSIIQTLSVNLDDKPYEKNAKSLSSTEDVDNQLFSTEKNLNSEIKDDAKFANKSDLGSDGLRLRKSNMEQNSGLDTRKEQKNSYQDYSGSDSESRLKSSVSCTAKFAQAKKDSIVGAQTMQESSKIVESGGALNIPTEWVPPNLSIPILNLVDVIFQLKDGGWIRRQAFWIAKQLLQLGMGDAFDDWLIEKIQLLRRGLVIASTIKRIEQILWPDGIFITKHPKRKATTPVSSPGSQSNQKDNMLTTEQQLEADRRAKFVYELIIDKAPATLVSLVGGRKEYEQCAQDIYFFLQSPVCLKQFALELLELLLLSAFPELDDIVRQYHEENQQLKEGNR